MARFDTDRPVNGRRFVLLFGIGLVVFLVVGVALTWALGRALVPVFEGRTEPSRNSRQ